MMKRFHNKPEFVSMWGACTKRPNMALVYELVEGGSLADRIHKGAPMSFTEIFKAGRDIAKGLMHLHPTVLHRDLKPANILIGADGGCKLIDFGLSSGKDPFVSCISNQTGGTLNYMSPEILKGSRINEKIDIYALGMILFECLERKVPWHGCNEARIRYLVPSVRAALGRLSPSELNSPLRGSLGLSSLTFLLVFHGFT